MIVLVTVITNNSIDLCVKVQNIDKRMELLHLLNAKDCCLTWLQSYLFDFFLKILEFRLFHWSEFDICNWLVWRMSPPHRSGREDKYPHTFSVFSWWSLVFFEPSYSIQTNAVIKNPVFRCVSLINMNGILWGRSPSIKS